MGRLSGSHQDAASPGATSSMIKRPDWQRKHERAALSKFALRPDLAAVPLNNAAGNGQAQAGAAAPPVDYFAAPNLPGKNWRP
jgi:hypothetical protein